MIRSFPGSTHLIEGRFMAFSTADWKSSVIVSGQRPIEFSTAKTSVTSGRNGDMVFPTLPCPRLTNFNLQCCKLSCLCFPFQSMSPPDLLVQGSASNKWQASVACLCRYQAWRFINIVTISSTRGSRRTRWARHWRCGTARVLIMARRTAGLLSGPHSQPPAYSDIRAHAGSHMGYAFHPFFNRAVDRAFRFIRIEISIAPLDLCCGIASASGFLMVKCRRTSANA